MILYVDILLLIHTILNGALLFLVGRWLMEPILFWRIAVASFAGSLVTIAFLLTESFLLALFGYFLCSALVLLIAFPRSSIRQRFRQLIVVCIASGLLIGSALVLEQALRPMGISLHTIAIILLGTFIFAVQSRVFDRRRVWRSCMVPVKVCMGSISVHATGLVDTGNHLRDPLTHAPVLIMDSERWLPYIPRSWREVLRSGNTDSLNASNTDHFWGMRFRWIPFRGVGSGRQWMIAFSPDAVYLDQRCVAKGEVLIGLRAGKLRLDDAYTALIPIALVA